MDWRDIALINEGKHTQLYEVLGCHKTDVGYRFSVYAPNAKAIFVFGSFNHWNKYEYELIRDETGCFNIELDVPEYSFYKYVVIGCDHVERIKADPFAFFSSLRPGEDSVVMDIKALKKHRFKYDFHYQQPLSMYEAHLGGYKHHWSEPYAYTYEDLKSMVDYVKQSHFNVIEVMPLTEYPFDGSWGYQPTGFYSPTSRYGSPTQLRNWIKYAHQQAIPVILDFVLGHFCVDSHGLNMFDGTPLYERDYNSLWGVYTFNYESGFVRSFLISSVFFFLKEYQFDGIRVDAVSYILYQDGDVSRGMNPGGEYFLKSLNQLVHKHFSNKKIMIAEDSSTHYHVTHPDGLDFDYKWCLGWMHDILKYFSYDPYYRPKVFEKLTFSFVYMFDERYVLPFSHDEVVHLKKPMLLKMFGNRTQQYAQYRQLLAHMFGHPGKKLNFMGNEFAVVEEFNEARELNWSLLQYQDHQQFKYFVEVLGEVYSTCLPLFERDHLESGFKYHYEHVENNLLVYQRIDQHENKVYVVMNTSGSDYQYYRLPVDGKEPLNSVLNSSDPKFGGRYKISDYYEVKEGFIYIDLPAFTTIYLYQPFKED